MLLMVTGGVNVADATILHIGLEINYTGNVYVYYFGGTNSTTWDSEPTATYDGVLYGRRWYHIDIYNNTSAIVRFKDNNWNDRGREVSDISGDDCYIYVSSEETNEYIDGNKVWNTGKLASKGWQTMKFSNDVDNKWDDDAFECTKVDDNTFTYTLTKEQIDAANKTTIYFRYKLANGVFFVNNNYWNDHFFRLGSNDSQNGNVEINVAQSITNNSYTTDQQKNWYVNVPTYNYEKLVFTIQDVTSGSDFNNSTWKVSVDAYISKTVSGVNQYATFGTTVPVDLSYLGSVTAYTATADASTGKITKVAKSDALAANEGVLLENLTGSNITLSIPVAASANASASNNLKAYTGGNAKLAQVTETGYTNYILSKDGTGNVGFFKVNGTSGNTMGANTAYLQVQDAPNSTARNFFSFLDEETTGINAVENAKMEGAAYNLNGQRVAQPAKGLYIVNGKKVILK